jgi:hypothetical protein
MVVHITYLIKVDREGQSTYLSGLFDQYTLHTWTSFTKPVYIIYLHEVNDNKCTLHSPFSPRWGCLKWQVDITYPIHTSVELFEVTSTHYIPNAHLSRVACRGHITPVYNKIRLWDKYTIVTITYYIPH